MGGSPARKLRRKFTRAAGGSMEKANYATDLLEQLMARTAAHNQAIVELQSNYNALVEGIKTTISTIAKDFNRQINAHNSTTLALAALVEECGKHGIRITPPGGGSAFPGIQRQTASGIALPAGVVWADDEAKSGDDPAPGGDATIASDPANDEAVGDVRADPSIPGPRPETEGGA